MNYASFFVLTAVAFFQLTQPMEQQFLPANKAITISNYLGQVVPITWAAYSKDDERMVNSQKGILEKKSVLKLSDQVWNVMSLVLPTSPCCVYFNIEECVQPHLKMSDNNVHYGDTVSIDHDNKNVSLYNETTEKLIALLPKENSYFYMGVKQHYNYQPKKEFNVHNLNIHCIIVKKKACRTPLQDRDGNVINETKLIRLASESILRGSGAKVVTFSTEDEPDIVKSIVTLKMCGVDALQQIKIRSSCDEIQNGDTLYIRQTDDHYIVMFKIIHEREHVLAKICTKKIRIAIPVSSSIKS